MLLMSRARGSWQGRRARPAPSRRRGNSCAPRRAPRGRPGLAAENGIGVDQALPAGEVAAVALEALGQAVDHLRDHAGAVLGRKLLGGRHVRGRGPGAARLDACRRRRGAGRPRRCGLPRPARHGASAGASDQQRLVVGERVGELAVLLLGQRQPEARLEPAGLALAGSSRRRDGPPRRRCRRRRARRIRQSPASRRTVSPSQARGVGVGGGGLAEAPELEIDGGDDVPALAVLGMLAQPRFDLGDELADVGLLERRIACGPPWDRTAGPASRA